MGQRLDSESREILEFRPDIQRIEPAVQPGVIEGTKPADSVEDLEDRIDKITKLANAVNVLAEATQARADIRAQDMVIKLDPAADYSTVAAMSRMFPDANPLEITYAQYRQCKDNQRAKGAALAEQVLISPEEIESARKNAKAAQGTVNYRDVATTAMYGTAEARYGQLRPELVKSMQILPPVNTSEFQDVLIRLLVNFIWKNFIKPGMQTACGSTGVGAIVSGIIEAVPDEIAELPPGFKVADIVNLGTPVLGEELPKYMTDIPDIPANLEQAQAQQDQEKDQ